MNKLFIKSFMAFNTWLIRQTNGRLGTKLNVQTVLILHTIGRKSAQDRAVPIAYFHYQRDYLIVASNWGQDKHPDWYLNLKKEPRAKLEINGQFIPVIAREALDTEYQQLWQWVTERYTPYLKYQEMTSRRIPIMVFEPV